MVKKIGFLLDSEDIIKDSYILEVSSPGVYRPLKKEKDYERFKGERIKVKLFSPIRGNKLYIGRIKDFKEGKIILETEFKNEVEIPIEKIAKANLEPELKI